MGWTVPLQEHKIFERNPLVAVVVELRFHPILKVPERVADFQERVRGTFPGYHQIAQQFVSLGPAAPVELRNETVFSFPKADGSAVLTLATGSLSLEARRHEHRENFIADAKVGVDALAAVHGPVAATRLGLRYFDVIDKERIEGDLKRTTTWEQLIAEPFLRVPTGLANLDGTFYAAEVTSPVALGGAMTVRHALLRDVDGRVKFRLDVDRYRDGAVETTDVVALLNGFANDIFSVFTLSMGPDLKAWMPEKRT